MKISPPYNKSGRKSLRGSRGEGKSLCAIYIYMVHKHTYAVLKYSRGQVLKYSITHVLKYASTQVHKYSCKYVLKYSSKYVLGKLAGGQKL